MDTTFVIAIIIIIIIICVRYGVGWTRHSEIKKPEAEADRCPARRALMVRTSSASSSSLASPSWLVSCIDDNLMVRTSLASRNDMAGG